ncbi:MAG: hypothetical protein VX737_01785 [Pseudomonadota bacterium]|nr:hypothetical protein [Pseudomonadota bacterium]
MLKKDSNITNCVIIFFLLLTILIAIFYDQLSIQQIKNNWQLCLTGLFVIIFFITLALGHRYLSEKKGVSFVNNFFQFPIDLCVSLLTFIVIIQVVHQVDSAKSLEEKKLTKILAKYGDIIVIDNIEKNAIKYKGISRFYENILTEDFPESKNEKALWEERFPNIPYVKYEENKIEWHYSSIFIRQMISIINVFDMKKILPLSNKQNAFKLDLKETEERKSILLGWMVCFKLFLKNPTVRNSWEKTKSVYADSDTIAWVQQYIINDFENNPEYFKEHRKSWDAEVTEILKKKDQSRKDAP